MSVNFEGTPANVTEGLQVFTAVGVGGFPGAMAGCRFVGATVSGPPESGMFAARDFVIDGTAAIWICTAAGEPGTWTPGGMLLPSGTPVAGAVPVATGNGQETAWSTGVLMDETGGLLS